jgi:carboxylesterase type B
MAPLDCTAQGPPFWGVHDGVAQGSFDALNLNVYTNNINPTAAYPVMVFIHGGGWQTGSASTSMYGPDFLVTNNVTIVTINYRLGAFGFLSLDDSTLNVPGNQALKDQRMALRWVQVGREFSGLIED